MNIRTATRQDTSALARLSAEVLQLHADAEPHRYRHPSPEDLPAIAAWFEERLADPDTRILVGILEGKPVAYAVLQIWRRSGTPFLHPEKCLYVDQFGVAKGYHNRGLGTQLLEAVLELARSLGVDQVRLDVRAANQHALAFYTRRSFQVERYTLQVGPT